MRSDKFVMLVTTEYYSPYLVEEIRGVTPHVCIMTSDDLRSDPSLIGRVEVVFGRLDHDLFPRAGCLKWLQTTFAGVDWANHPQITSHPVILTSAHIHAVPISEHLFGMLLMLTRSLHTAYRQQLKRVWDKSALLSQIKTISGRTLCVIGLGVVGRCCAMLGKAYGMSVIGVRRCARAVPYVEHIYEPDKIREALSQADVVMVALPKTEETRKLIGRTEFAAMRKGVFFLNGGRGQTVDTDALVEALRNGTVKGAGLDVVNPEPLPPKHPLWEMANVIITPHVAGWFPRYEENVIRVFLNNLRRYVRGEPLQFVVDKNKGY